MRREHVIYLAVALLFGLPIGVLVIVEAIAMVTGHRPTVGVLGL